MKYYTCVWIIKADKIRNGNFHNVLNKSVELNLDLKFIGMKTDDNLNAIRFVLEIIENDIPVEFAKFVSNQLGATEWTETSDSFYRSIFADSIREQRQKPNYSTNLRLIDGLISEGLENQRNLYDDQNCKL